MEKVVVEERTVGLGWGMEIRACWSGGTAEQAEMAIEQLAKQEQVTCGQGPASPSAVELFVVASESTWLSADLVCTLHVPASGTASVCMGVVCSEKRQMDFASAAAAVVQTSVC